MSSENLVVIVSCTCIYFVNIPHISFPFILHVGLKLGVFANTTTFNVGYIHVYVNVFYVLATLTVIVANVNVNII